MPLNQYEYLQLRLADITEDIWMYFKLKKKTTEDGFVYEKDRKGIYGLPQAGLVAQELLEQS